MKRAILFLFAIVLMYQSYAQRFLGVATGNYNAMNSLYLNPANIAGCNEKLTISLFSANVGVDNSLGTITAIGDIGNSISSDSGGNGIFKPTAGNKKFSMMLPMAEIRGPGILYSINSKNTLALTTRVRVFNEFNDFNRSLYDVVSNTSTVQNGVVLNSQNFNWTAHAWSEIGLTYGAVLVDNSDFQIKGGVTLRYLMGIGYLGIKGKNLDVKYVSGADSFAASNSDLEFASNIAKSGSSLSSGPSLFGGSDGGKGFGADVGLTLIYKPDNNSGYESNVRMGGYKAAFSIAMTDIGSINYKTSYAANITGNGTLTSKGITDNVKNFDDFTSYVKSQGFGLDSGARATKVYLPTAIVVGVDYNAYKNAYVSATLISNIASNSNFGSVYYSQLTITPRWDTKIFSAGIPLTYNMLTNNLRMGLGIRFSGFFIGSDDMLALLSSNQYGFNFYLGGMIPIYKKHRNGMGN